MRRGPMRKNRVFIAMIAMALVVGIAQIGIAEELLKVVELKGGVLVKTYPSTDWAAAAAGQVLNPKDSIKTQETGGVVLEFPDKSSMTLKQDSELSVEDLLWTPAEQKVNLSLSTGQLRTILQKLGPKSEFKVKTPSAVCGARGSIFYIIVIGMLTRLFVEDGLMEFINTMSGESQDVGAGMSSNTSDDGTVSPPAETSDDDKNTFTTGWDEGLVAEPYAEPE